MFQIIHCQVTAFDYCQEISIKQYKTGVECEYCLVISTAFSNIL